MTEKQIEEQVSDGLVAYDRDKARRQIVTSGMSDPVTESFIATLDARWRLAKALVASRMIPQKTTEAAIAVMLKAHELGVPAMQGFGSIHYFDGNLILGAQLMHGIAVRRCGVTTEILEHTDKVCRIRFERKGWKPIEAEFTFKEAEAAGLLKIKADGKKRRPWHEYPKDMLYNRALARGVRMIAPDYFAATYEWNEAQDADMIPARPETSGGAGIDDLRARLDGTTEDTEVVEAEEPQEPPDKAPFLDAVEALGLDLMARQELLDGAKGNYTEALSRARAMLNERKETQ